MLEAVMISNISVRSSTHSQLTLPDPDPDPVGATVGGRGPDPEPDPVGGRGTGPEPDPVDPPIPLATQAHLDPIPPMPPPPVPLPAPDPGCGDPDPVGVGSDSALHLEIAPFPFFILREKEYIPISTTPVPEHFLSHFAVPLHLAPFASRLKEQVQVFFPSFPFSFLKSSILSVAASLPAAGGIPETKDIRKSGTHWHPFPSP